MALELGGMVFVLVLLSIFPLSGGNSRSLGAGGSVACPLPPMEESVIDDEAGIVVVFGAVPAVSGIRPVSPVSTADSGAGCDVPRGSVAKGPATASLTFETVAFNFEATLLSVASLDFCFDRAGLASAFVLAFVVDDDGPDAVRPFLAAGGGATGSFGAGRLRSSTMMKSEQSKALVIDYAPEGR